MSASRGGVSTLGAGGRLSLGQITYLRAIAQGLSVQDAAKRYLDIDHGAEAIGAHRLVVDQVAAIARRRHDPRWRLLGLVLEDTPGQDQLGPPLQEWAEAQGLDGFSERELQALYVERFGAPSPQAARRQARIARLRAGRLALLHDLERAAAVPAAPTDLLAGWLAPELAEQLKRLGLLMLLDLQRRILRGGRWWLGIPSYGPVKAGRLAAYLASLLPAPAPHRWAVPIEHASQLDGSNGALRATGTTATSATNDREAIDAWIAARARSPATARSYRREAERFVLWMIAERGKAMSDASVEDCTAYVVFATDPPDRWISHRSAPRLAAGWAPFRGPLGRAALALATTALHSLFGWLTRVRYLTVNPWAAVNRHWGDDPAASLAIDVSRAFTPPVWRALRAQVLREQNKASAARISWLLVFGEGSGLRPSELVSAKRGDLLEHGGHWYLRVHGKGRKNRLVVLPSTAIAETRTYFAARGLAFEGASAETRLLAALAGGPLTYRALHETLTRFIARALRASSLPEAERRHAATASTHWLRHTHATRATERGVGIRSLQDQLGHEDPRTTSRYDRAQIARRAVEIETAFADEEPLEEVVVDSQPRTDER